jgi:hypothetical protein
LTKAKAKEAAAQYLSAPLHSDQESTPKAFQAYYLSALSSQGSGSVLHIVTLLFQQIQILLWTETLLSAASMQMLTVL